MMSSWLTTRLSIHIVYIQSGSSSSLVGYGNSSSSNCFLSASFCICFMASAKGAESTSCFSTPPHLIPGSMGKPKDIGVLWLDPLPDPGAWKSPTSMGEPGGRPSNRQSSCLVTGKATPLARPPMPGLLDPLNGQQTNGWYGCADFTIGRWCFRSWHR